jgi:ribosomal protein L32
VTITTQSQTQCQHCGSWYLNGNKCNKCGIEHDENALFVENKIEKSIEVVIDDFDFNQIKNALMRYEGNGKKHNGK